MHRLIYLVGLIICYCFDRTAEAGIRELRQWLANRVRELGRARRTPRRDGPTFDSPGMVRLRYEEMVEVVRCHFRDLGIFNMGTLAFRETTHRVGDAIYGHSEVRRIIELETADGRGYIKLNVDVLSGLGSHELSPELRHLPPEAAQPLFTAIMRFYSEAGTTRWARDQAAVYAQLSENASRSGVSVSFALGINGVRIAVTGNSDASAQFSRLDFLEGRGTNEWAALALPIRDTLVAAVPEPVLAASAARRIQFDLAWDDLQTSFLGSWNTLPTGVHGLVPSILSRKENRTWQRLQSVQNPP